MSLHKGLITPVGIASYVHVWEMTKLLNGQMAYNMAILLPKSNEEGIKSIRQAIASAAREKWGDDKKKWPAKLVSPLHDGDAPENQDKPENYRKCFYMNPKTDRQPGVVGPNAKPIMDQDEFYSGCYCRVSVNFFGYDKGGNKGVGVGLNNVMKIKDGPRLDGRKSAESEFDAYKDPDAPDTSEGTTTSDDFLDE